MSNGPVELLTHISKVNRIDWDMITPIERKRVYKRRPEAYMTMCELFRVKPREVLIITANPTFGDVVAAQALLRYAKRKHRELLRYRISSVACW